MNIDYTKPFSEEFIQENKDKINWIYISIFHSLNEEFIREFQHKVYWFYISYSQKLSENFIREFKDKVDWDNISANQNLNINFIEEFQDKVNLFELLFKLGYTGLKISNEKYSIIVNENYHLDDLSFSEFKKIALKLISLKAFQ